MSGLGGFWRVWGLDSSRRAAGARGFCRAKSQEQRARRKNGLGQKKTLREQRVQRFVQGRGLRERGKRKTGEGKSEGPGGCPGPLGVVGLD
jgi:hypothetical protein